jgi:hypothetical protein
MPGPSVFISYSHTDKAWKDRLVTHLGVLQREGLIDPWDAPCCRRISTMAARLSPMPAPT